MFKNVILLFIVVCAIGCNKVKRIEKKIGAAWNITTYTYRNINGLSYKYPASGKFIFDNCNTEYCDYSLQMTYTANGVSYQKLSDGQYSILDDAEYYELHQINGLGDIKILSGRIIHINKTQLETVFTDESGSHFFILEKN